MPLLRANKPNIPFDLHTININIRNNLVNQVIISSLTVIIITIIITTKATTTIVVIG